jgi:hypothetical protein
VYPASQSLQTRPSTSDNGQYGNHARRGRTGVTLMPIETGVTLVAVSPRRLGLAVIEQGLPGTRRYLPNE